MNKTYSLDGVQAILSYPFKQLGWQSKFAIAAGLSLANYAVPILPAILLMGYIDTIMQGIIVDGAEPTLPEWDDWGNLFSRGVKIFGATTIYLLPVILFLVIGYFVMTVAPFMSMMFLPDYDTNSRAVAGVIGIQLLITFAGIFFFSIGFILVSLIGFMLPVVISHVVAKNSFAAAFHVKEWWQVARANLWGFIIAISLTTGIYLLGFMAIRALYLTIILCILTPFLSIALAVYMTVISSVLFAEAYRKGTENLAAASI